MSNAEKQNLLKKMVQEMRRGILSMAVLAMLPDSKYGYQILKELNGTGLSLSQDTLYPLLRRLEQQGMLSSEWKVDGSRPRKYYRTNDFGREMLELLKAEWQAENDAMKEILK